MAAISVDARKLANSITVEIEMKNKRYFSFGVLLIRLGCLIAGFEYREKE